MRNFVILVVFMVSFQISAQDTEMISVQKTIETFFEGFHEQDSLKIKRTVSDEIVLQTVGIDKSGNTAVLTQDFNDFLQSIVSIPETTKFHEIIKRHSIQIDGAMAHVWTPYEFRVDNNFHHCGVNSFQLFKDTDKGWQIIYLIDTRRKEQCD